MMVNITIWRFWDDFWEGQFSARFLASSGDAGDHKKYQRFVPTDLFHSE